MLKEFEMLTCLFCSILFIPPAVAGNQNIVKSCVRAYLEAKLTSICLVWRQMEPKMIFLFRVQLKSL